MKAIAAAVALAACGGAPTAKHSPRWSRTTTTAHDARALYAPDPTVSRVVVLVRVPLGTTDGEQALALAHSLDTLDFKDGWSTVDVRLGYTDLMIEVPSDHLHDALRADAARFDNLGATALPADDSRARVLDRARATRQLGLAPALKRYAQVQVVIVGNFDVERAAAWVAETFGDRAVFRRATHDGQLPRGRVLHDRERDRVTIAYDALDRASTRVAAKLLLAKLPGVDARVDPPFTIELNHATSPEPVFAAIAELTAPSAAHPSIGDAIAEVELEHLTGLENLAYRARALASSDPMGWELRGAHGEDVYRFFQGLRDPLVVIGDLE